MMDGNAVDCFRPSSWPQWRAVNPSGEPLDRASLSLWQLAPARPRDFNQGFDADQPSLVVLEPGGRFFPPRHERVHPLSQEYDVLAVLDHFGDETHAVACGAKSSTIP